MIRIECKKNGLKQLIGNDWVLSLVVSNDDMKASGIGSDSMGQIYIMDMIRAEEEQENAVYTEVEFKKSTPFNELKLSNQAALLCERPDFQRFIVAANGGYYKENKDGAREALIDLCEIDSRSKLDIDEVAATTFREIQKNYDKWKVDEMYKDNLGR